MDQKSKKRLLSLTNIVITFGKQIRFSFQPWFWLFLATSHITVYLVFTVLASANFSSKRKKTISLGF